MRRRRTPSARTREVDRLARKAVPGIVIAVLVLIAIAILIVLFTPELLQKIKMRRTR